MSRTCCSGRSTPLLFFFFLVWLHQKMQFEFARTRGQILLRWVGNAGCQTSSSEETFHSDSIRTRRSPHGPKYPFDTSWWPFITQLEPNTDVPAARREKRWRDWSKTETAARASTSAELICLQTKISTLAIEQSSIRLETNASWQLWPEKQKRESNHKKKNNNNKQMRNGGQVNGCQQQQPRQNTTLTH